MAIDPDNLTSPDPIFWPFSQGFRSHIVGNDTRAPSFLPNAIKRSEDFIMPTSERGLAVQNMHALFRRLGHCYTDLLQAPDAEQAASKSFMERFQDLGARKEITLHFAKGRKPPPTPITIRNELLVMQGESDRTIGQLLFLLGEASEEIDFRPNPARQIIIDHVGQAGSIPRHIRYAYRFLYTALQEHGYAPDEAKAALNESWLDIPKEVFNALVRDIKKPEISTSRI